MRKPKIVAVTFEQKVDRAHVGIPKVYLDLLRGCSKVEVSEGKDGTIVLNPVRAGGSA